MHTGSNPLQAKPARVGGRKSRLDEGIRPSRLNPRRPPASKILALASSFLLLTALPTGSVPAYGSWTNLSPPESPSPRMFHAMAYDSESDRIILFGGGTGSSLLTVVNETWSYDFNTNTWTNLNPPASPSPRMGHAMAYDSESDRIVLFGGERAILFGDTWSYDFNTNTWTNLNPPESPSPRSGHAMAYDSRSDRIILFGGATQGGFLGDTWAYDLGTNTWTNLTSSVGPSARILHAMAFDDPSGRLILFGGYTRELQWSNETWSYDFNTNTWTNLNPPESPSPRTSHAMAYDSESDRIILFGGLVLFGGYVQESDNQTWAFDFDTVAWTQMHPATSPPSRAGHAMAYDSESDRIILFGGVGKDLAKLAGTWSYRFPGPLPVSFPWVLLFSYLTATSTGIIVILLLWHRGKRKGHTRSGEGPGRQRLD